MIRSPKIVRLFKRIQYAYRMGINTVAIIGADDAGNDQKSMKNLGKERNIHLLRRVR
ncbi:MAG: hypothetical protein WAV05_18985 [Anaerolineales bacterium]